MAFAGYSGQAYAPAGDKSRYVLPPQFRKAVRDSSDGRVLCLAKHDRWNCLTGFGLARTESFESQLDREEDNAIRLGNGFDRELRSTQLWSFTEAPFDASGRFVLPEHLAELCAIDQGICFLGGGPFFTLWAPKQLYRMGAGWEGQQALCRKLEADAKGKRK